MSDLFADAARERMQEVAPLALRLRPRSLDEFVGQEQVLGERSALRLAIAEDRVGSAILYGPPGTGKTTLARIVAETTGAAFEELSAVSASVKDVREVLARARERLGGSGQRTILFLDEIHRFNKAQQDALLPAVEEGLVTLIGATTENPYFEVNSALLSRCQIYELQPLAEEQLRTIVTRGAAALETEAADEVVALVAHRAGGDARNALNILELAAQTARAEGIAAERAARRGRGPQAPARLRQGRRRALRLHLGLHQVDARLRPGRGRLLPRRDARRRRGRTLHRPADGGARLRGHRQRRPARAAGRGRRRAGGRARRPAGSAVEPVPGGDLPRAGAQVERLLRGAQRGDRRRARAGPGPAAGRAPRRPLSRREEARPRRGLRLSAQRPARLRDRPPPRAATRARPTTGRAARARRATRTEVCFHGGGVMFRIAVTALAALAVVLPPAAPASQFVDQSARACR